MIFDNDPKPPEVRPDELRKGDLIRAVWKVNSSHSLQFVVRELDSDNVGGTFGDFDILLPITESWDFFLLKPAPRISENYTFGWLQVEAVDNSGIASTILGYWRTNNTGDGDFVEGIVVTYGDGAEHRKYPLDLVVAFTEAYATRQLQPHINWTSTTNPVGTYTSCSCCTGFGGKCQCS